MRKFAALRVFARAQGRFFGARADRVFGFDSPSLRRSAIAWMTCARASVTFRRPSSSFVRIAAVSRGVSFTSPMQFYKQIQYSMRGWAVRPNC